MFNMFDSFPSFMVSLVWFSSFFFILLICFKMSSGNIFSFIIRHNGSGCLLQASKVILIFCVFVLSTNIAGLFPFVFSLTAQLCFVVGSLAMFWLSMVIFWFWKNSGYILSLFTMGGKGAGMSVYMALIEFVSFSVRPLTLCVRLLANVSVGHVVMGMCFMQDSSLFAMGVYFFVELFVMSVQAYIVYLLLNNYFVEISTSHYF